MNSFKRNQVVNIIIFFNTREKKILKNNDIFFLHQILMHAALACSMFSLYVETFMVKRDDKIIFGINYAAFIAL